MSSSSPPPCAEPDSVEDDETESKIISNEAHAGDETVKRGGMEPKRTCLRLNYYFHELVRVWKHLSSHVSRAGRCDQQRSAAVDQPVLKAWSREAASLFEPLSE